MCDCSHSLRRTVLTLAALLLAASPLLAQPQTPVTPRAPFASPAFVSPISPFLFGQPAYPFRATAPSSTTPAPSSAQISGVSHAPSLGSISLPSPPASPMGLATHSQANLGAFIGFAPLSSLSLTDSTSPLPGGTYRPAADNSAYNPACAGRRPGLVRWQGNEADGHPSPVQFAALDSRQEVRLRGACPFGERWQTD